MTILAVLTLLLIAGFLVLWRELRRAPLLPPGYDADGQPLTPTHREAPIETNATPRQLQEARR